MTDQRQGGKDMKLKIAACRQVYSGVNRRGDSYTIYEVEAHRAQDGVKINQKLRSFTALAIGQEIEVTVVPFNSEQHGRSFTLYPKNSKGGVSTTDQLNELKEQLDEAFSRIAKLSQRVGALEGAHRTETVAEVNAGGSVQSRAAQNFGDDPGF
jgi:hypothetical protein